MKEGYWKQLQIVFEPAIIGEYYFVKNYSENSYLFTRRKEAFIWHLLKSLDFYAFAGIGGAVYNVKGNDALIELQEDPERDLKDSGFTAVIPAGLGTTLIYSPNLNFGLEVGEDMPLLIFWTVIPHNIPRLTTFIIF